MVRLLDVLERTLWTAIQAFAASVVVTGAVGLGDLKIAAVAAAIAVAKSLSVSTTVQTGQELAKTSRKR